MDIYSVLRTGASNLTADETLEPYRVGPMMKPLWLHVVVPSDSSGDTLDVELEFCDTATPTTEVYNMNMKQITGKGHYSVPFFTKQEYLQVKLNVTGSGIDFGAVKVWVDVANRANNPETS